MSESIEELASRAERLERQNKCLKAAVLGVGLLAGAGILAAVALPMRRRYRFPRLPMGGHSRLDWNGGPSGKSLQAVADLLRWSGHKRRVGPFG